MCVRFTLEALQREEIISVLGFVLLGVVWLTSSFLAYHAIRKKQLQRHQHYMIISYGGLPILSSLFDDFITAYRIVAWISWVPNLVVAYFLISRKKIQPSET